MNNAEQHVIQYLRPTVTRRHHICIFKLAVDDKEMIIHPLPGVLAAERCSDPRGSYAGKPPFPLNYAPQRCLSIKLRLTKKFRINWRH